MTVKHDPTPWQLEGGHQWLSTTHPSPLFELVPVVGTEAEHKANAEFIVKACNMHDELLEALQMAEELYQIGILGAPEGLLEKVVDLRRAAIAKATGGAA